MNNKVPSSFRSIDSKWRGSWGFTELVVLVIGLGIALVPLMLGQPIGVKSTSQILWLVYTSLIMILTVILLFPLMDGTGRKGYNFVIYVFLYLIDHKKYGTTKTPVDLLFPFDNIDGNILEGPNTLATVTMLTGNNITIFRESTQDTYMSNLMALFEKTTSTIQIVKADRRFDYTTWLKTLQDSIEDEVRIYLEHNGRKFIKDFDSLVDFEKENAKYKTYSEMFNDYKTRFNQDEIFALDKKLKGIQYQIEAIEFMNDQEFFESTYFVIALNNNEIDLLADTAEIESVLSDNEHQPLVLGGHQLLSFISSYYKRNNVKFDEIAKDKFDIKEILPSKVTFKSNHYIEEFEDGEKWFCRVFEISSLPNQVNDFWIANMMHSTGDTYFMRFATFSQNKLRKIADKKARIIEDNSLMDTSSRSQHIETSMHEDSNDSLLEHVMQGGTVQKATFSILVYEKNYEDFTLAVKELRNRFKGLGNYNLDSMYFRQKEAYRMIMPTNTNKRFNKEYTNPTTENVAVGYPFTSAKLQDPGAPILGVSDSGVPIMLDIKTRDSDRMNSNVTVIGKSGGGKSYFVKKFTINMITQGVKCFIFDPESEYTNLSISMGGAVMEMGALSKFKLNPLQNFSVHTTEDKEEQEVPSMQIHYTSVQHFLTIACDLVKEEALVLMKYIALFFKHKNITNENFIKLKNSDWPVLSEFIAYFNKQLDEFPSLSPFDTNYRQSLQSKLNYVLDDPTKVMLWNHKTNFDTKDISLTVFDINQLKELKDTTIINAQYLILIKYVENKVYENKRKYYKPIEDIQRQIMKLNDNPNKDNTYSKQLFDLNVKLEKAIKTWARMWVAIMIDEAHLLVSSKHPEVIQFIYEMIKRIRKYNGITVIITQNLRDFTNNEEFKKEMMAILNNATYQFIFQLRDDDINQLKELYAESGGITDGETNYISKAQVGHCLAMIGQNARQMMRIQATYNERSLMGENK